MIKGKIEMPENVIDVVLLKTDGIRHITLLMQLTTI